MIVGASGAIGSAMACSFAKEGARLALTYHRSKPEGFFDTKGSGQPEIRHYALNITDWTDVQTSFQKVEDDFSGIDVVVNCAGIIGPIGQLEDTDPTQWNKALEVNLIGSVYLARAALPVLKRRGRGKIIFFSGGGAAYGRPYLTAYSTAKAAVVRFTESLALELKDTDIQVNAIAPGPIESRMWDEMRVAGGAGGSPLLEELRRMSETGGVSPDQATALAVFLASDDSKYVTGKLVSALWDDWAGVKDSPDKLHTSEAWTLRRVPLK